jgi:hypothetical protein
MIACSRLKKVERFFPAAPIAILTIILAWRTLRELVGQVGEPCGTLDDSFIHFQYARAIAELHPFHYEASMPATSGATSVLWPLALAPFYAIGFRGTAILWPAWLLGFGSLGLLANESYHLAKPLTSKWGALGSALMVLCFSAFTWCAASGMEVVPFAWVMARCARRASEWQEDPANRTRKRKWELVALAFAVALLRPEGALVALAIAGVLGIFQATHRERLVSIAPLAATFSTPYVLWLFTGSARSNTATAKLLVGNPYYQGHALWAAVSDNVSTLFKKLLNGQVWSTEFLPTNAMPVAIMALVSIVVAGFIKRRLFRAAFVLAIALGMLIPCFYVTFLWNRLRYLWPFATGWLIGLACFAEVLGEVATILHPRARAGVPVLLGFFAGAFIVRLDWVLDDVANSASGIDRQHVKIGRWAKDALPKDALVAVNDTGAIAYFSDRRTFDIVGLTTNGEAKYWVAGTASRIEHYEKMRKEDLPTHFIVYPEWMGTDAFFGSELFAATVTDSTILGGQSMRAYEADWTLLRSGERPWTDREHDPIDSVDVADLESEAAHGYELLARDNEEVVGDATMSDGHRIVDGGRGYRTADRFVAALHPNQHARCIARLAPTPTKGKATIDVRASGETIATLTLGDEDSFGSTAWSEQTFDVPADKAKEKTPLELVAREGSFASYHYWFIAE